MITNLERLALLGDRQSQRECTKKRIMLPCPLCRRRVRYYFSPKHEEGTKGDILVIPDKSYVRCVCGYSVSGYGADAAIEIHNKRPRPLIGQCKDCDSWRGEPEDEYAHCRDCDGVMEADNFCRNFEPREVRNNG